MGHAPSQQQQQQNSDTTNENGVGDKTSALGALLSQLNQTLQAANQTAEKHTQVRLTWPAAVRSGAPGV